MCKPVTVICLSVMNYQTKSVLYLLYWPVDQVVPVKCGPVPGHVLPQRVVGHVSHHSEQILTPNHTLIFSSFQEPVRQIKCYSLYTFILYNNIKVALDKIIHAKSSHSIRQKQKKVVLQHSHALECCNLTLLVLYISNQIFHK